MPLFSPQSFATRHSPPDCQRVCTRIIHWTSASFVFILLRTLLHCAIRQALCHQLFPHSLQKTPGVGCPSPFSSEAPFFRVAMSSGAAEGFGPVHGSELYTTRDSLPTTHCLIQTNPAAPSKSGPTVAGIGTTPPAESPPASASASPFRAESCAVRRRLPPAFAPGTIGPS